MPISPTVSGRSFRLRRRSSLACGTVVEFCRVIKRGSIAEIVAHIADTELVGGYRIRAILGAPGSQIIGFDQDKWVTALHYEKRNLRKSFETYRALREANLALLKTLTPEQRNHHD